MRKWIWVWAGVFLAAAAMAASTFTSADGKTTVTAKDDGSVVGPQGKTICKMDAAGACYKGDGTCVGKLEGDTFTSENGEKVLTFESDGTIVMRREMGRIDGTNVYAPDGTLIGTLSDTSPQAKNLALMALRRYNGRERREAMGERGGKGGPRGHGRGHSFDGPPPGDGPPPSEDD